MTPEIQRVPDIRDKVVLLKWSRTRFSNKRRERAARLNGKVSERMFTVHKRLLRSKAYGRILSHDTYITTYLCQTACQTGIFGRAGIYAVPIAMVPQIHAELTARQAVRDELVQAFVATYAADIERTRQELGDMFRQGDYPTPEALAASFSCGWSFISLGLNLELGAEIEPAIFEAEQRKAREMFERVAGDVRDVLRVGLAKLVSGMVDRLQPAADGKKKALHETFLEKFSTFIATFDVRNVTDDKELADLVLKAKALIDGNDVSDWRADATFRSQALLEFEAVNAQLSQWVVEAGDRLIEFDDEVGVA